MRAAAVERRIETFVARDTPAIAAQLRDARRRLRARFPRGVERVFDNDNALVFGIGSADGTRESFLSIAGYPEWVTPFLLDGASLRDPDDLLEGATRRDALAAAPPLSTVIKAEAAKQRPRRPASAKA
jgi:hypothetical protein